MTGRITIPPVKVCCKRVGTIMKKHYEMNINERINTFYRIKRMVSNNLFFIIFTLLFIFLLFVLYITNQKPAYNHEETVYDQHTIHNDHNSKYHYGVVIDCGSSGSRVFIYFWPPHTGSKEELLNMKQMIDIDGNPVQLKIKPGISSYADSPDNATHSLLPLLRFAAHHIPHKKHQETPLYILATAGMRLLPEEKRNSILENIRSEVPKLTSFYFTDSHVDVISGKQEGIYLWIATNYMLGRFDHSHETSVIPPSTVAPVLRKQTVGTIEIGGASIQIAYEVADNQSVPAELRATINLGCDAHATIHEYKIYVTTFLGYGTDRARNRYIHNLMQQNEKNLRAHEVVMDPCLPTELVDEQKYNNTIFKITGSGDFEQCQKDLIGLVNNNVQCDRNPCSFNGVHQATIDYRNTEFYGFGEFWYSSDDVLRMGGKYINEKLETDAKWFCKTRWSKLKSHHAMGFYPKADDFRFKYQCFKSAWMTTILHEGFKFPKDYTGLTTVKIIRGKEVQWTLGALLYRSRFMPLRDMKMESSDTVKVNQSRFWLIAHSGFYPILFLCGMVAIGFIITYCRRIRRFSRSSAFYNKFSAHDVLVQPQKSLTPFDIRVDM